MRRFDPAIFGSYLVVGVFCIIMGMGIATHFDRKIVDEAVARMNDAEARMAPCVPEANFKVTRFDSHGH